jgi:hypothetical protein
MYALERNAWKATTDEIDEQEKDSKFGYHNDTVNKIF